MGSMLNWKEKLEPAVADALRRGHVETRAKLVLPTMKGGRIVKAGRRAAEHCLPHFEHGEKCIFAVLEDEVICPAVAPIGDYLREKLAY